MAPFPKEAISKTFHSNDNAPAPRQLPSDDIGPPPFRCLGGKPLEVPRYLVRGILPEKGVALLAGQFSAGKTFVAINLALSLIYGHEFLGRKVKPGAALWLAAEGSGEIDARTFAARRENFKDDSNSPIPFQVAEKMPTGNSEQVIGELRRMVAASSVWMKEAYRDRPLRLVVIDTLPAFANLVDENANAEAAKAMKLLAEIGNESGVLILAITHFGKGADSGVRGASAFAAGADAILACTAEIDKATGVLHGSRSLALAKSRRGGTGPLATFTIANTVVGYDEDREEDRQGYVIFGSSVTDDNGKSVPHGVRILREAINEAMIAHGANVQFFSDALPKKAVKVDHVRDVFMRKYTVGDSTATATKRQAYGRAYKALRDGGRMGNHTLNNVEYIWLIDA
jgi:hypothetical protein